MPLSEKKRASNDRWIKENYTQVKLSMPNQEASDLESHCKKFNFTKAGFIRRAIKEAIERDNAAAESSSQSETSKSGGAFSGLLNNISEIQDLQLPAERMQQLISELKGDQEND